MAAHVNIACSDTIDGEAAITVIDSITGTSQRPAIVNLSWGGPPDTTLDRAINNSINAGVVYVISAGNNAGDACQLSPARVPAAITVAASNSSDGRWVWNAFQASNFGTCVDLFAPGQDITSLWLNGGTNTITGTSMAAPHVSGAAALYLERVPAAPPNQVWSEISYWATYNHLSNIGAGSPNRLLYSVLDHVFIAGLSHPPRCVTTTWSAVTWSFGSSFTYLWKKGFPSGFGGSVIWVTVGNGPTYTEDYCGDQIFYLKVTVTNEFGSTAVAGKNIGF